MAPHTDGKDDLREVSELDDTQVVSVKASMAAITISNHANSPFLRLPGEIRNQIYGYVLEEFHVHLYSWLSHCRLPTTSPPENGRPIVHTTLHSHALALKRVCHEIYDDIRFLKSTMTEIHGSLDSLWRFFGHEGMRSGRIGNHSTTSLRSLHFELSQEWCQGLAAGIRGSMRFIFSNLARSFHSLEHIVVELDKLSGDEDTQQNLKNKILGAVRSQLNAAHLRRTEEMIKISVTVAKI